MHKHVQHVSAPFDLLLRRTIPKKSADLAFDHVKTGLTTTLQFRVFIMVFGQSKHQTKHAGFRAGELRIAQSNGHDRGQWIAFRTRGGGLHLLPHPVDSPQRNGAHNLSTVGKMLVGGGGTDPRTARGLRNRKPVGAFFFDQNTNSFNKMRAQVAVVILCAGGGIHVLIQFFCLMPLPK